MTSSSTSRSLDAALAYALLRFILGLNIFMHGVSRIYSGVSGFAGGLLPEFHKTPLPPAWVYAFGVTLPFVEATLGGLLLLGLLTRYACALGLLLMAVLTFGTALHQDWNAASIQLIYAFVYAALLGLREHNSISLDHWIFSGRRTTEAG